MSSQANPYFQYIIGASITSAARFCLQQANKTCHELLGFKNKVALVEQPEMTQVTKDGETIWQRNYYISQEGAVTRINQNDTDAVFFQIDDLEFVQNMENFSAEFTQMEKNFANKLKANLLGSEILTMACEEIIIALFTSQSKKSYMRLDAVDYKKC